jgi:hypothetical protein
VTVIYAPWHGNLGDQIATIQLLLHRSYQTRAPVHLHSPPGLRALHNDLLANIDTPFPARLVLTSEPATAELSGYDVWATPYFSARIPWHDRQSHSTVAYHFSGASTPDDKNPPPEDLPRHLAALRASGFDPVPLGLPLSVTEQLSVLAHSAFCLAICSGPSHLAHMVGTPLVLLQHKLPVVTCHRGKAYILADGFEDAWRHKIPTLLDMRRFIGHPDGARSTHLARAQRDALDAQGMRWWADNG